MRWIVASLLIALPVAAFGGEETEKRTGSDEQAPRVYTNADLVKYAEPGDEAGPPEQEPTRQEAVPLPDPLEQIEAEEARRVSRLAQIQAAEAEVARLREEIGRLEKRGLAVRNPYLPRPELSKEEAKAWEGLSAVERLKRVEDQIAAAKDDLRLAEERLEAIRAKNGS